MSVDLILETEFELRRMYSFAMWTYVFLISPTHFTTNGHYAVQVYLLLQELMEEALESLMCCWGNSALSVSLHQIQSEMDILYCMLRRVVWGLIYRTGNYMWSLSYLLGASGWDPLTVSATPEHMQVQAQACCFAAKGCPRFQLLGGIWGCCGPHSHACSVEQFGGAGAWNAAALCASGYTGLSSS